MTRLSSIRLGILALVAVAASACGPQPTQPKPAGEVNIEGLQAVSARNFEAAFVRPGVRFADYRKLMVDELELAFRTPDREQNQFPLGEDQKTRFRAAMAGSARRIRGDSGHLRHPLSTAQPADSHTPPPDVATSLPDSLR